jgi:hypothetical protein
MDAAVKKPEAPTPAPEQPQELPNEITVKLRKAVMAHGEMVKSLTFRAPTGGDCMMLGEHYPLLIDLQTGDIRINPMPMGQIMSTLAQVPPSTIRLMLAKDFMKCAVALLGFFLPDEPGT